MGKNKKAHRKKVQARNRKIQIERKKFEKLYQEMLQEKLAELQQRFSGSTSEEYTTEKNPQPTE